MSAPTNWDDMRVFLAVARQEGLSGAGRLLRLDPATVGRRVARLERSLGAVLFAKSPQGYRLTEAGQRLLPRAEAAEASLRDGLDAAGDGAGGLTGTIRIGAPDGCANYLLPQVCARISAAHPDLDIQILALPRVVNLSRREADLAIAVSAPKTDRLRAERLADYRLSLAATPELLEREGTPLSVADLRGRRMIGYIPDMIFDAELDYLASLGVTRVTLASNAVSVQLNFARAGAGLAIVHDFALPFAPGLVRVLPGEVALARTFWLVTHAGPRDARLDRFATMLRDGLRAEVARLEASVA
ncbi:LysR family transcriptional regulator [Roseibacterium sp. SDUM158017]|uniref:LysR family transcriptional regulator n=1 Tax=Roseicyclus salinarum TaxID=3036773 RepID=UPI0024150BBB|nr:LysR family transcriptional regulator [Roseibacterium sp. SDUM158017]MDG4647587.1 LysR family transcriptional regulator [Roseibacterium sp. SDUM158017]